MSCLRLASIKEVIKCLGKLKKKQQIQATSDFCRATRLVQKLRLTIAPLCETSTADASRWPDVFLVLTAQIEQADPYEQTVYYAWLCPRLSKIIDPPPTLSHILEGVSHSIAK
ncbi:hypothetical protein CHS0354_027262, partial [Potamilus streckersoni]